VLAEAEALEEMLRVRTSEAMDLSECTRLDVPGGRIVAVADRTRTVKGMMHVVGSRGLRVQLIEEAVDLVEFMIEPEGLLAGVAAKLVREVEREADAAFKAQLAEGRAKAKAQLAAEKARARAANMVVERRRSVVAVALADQPVRRAPPRRLAADAARHARQRAARARRRADRQAHHRVPPRGRLDDLGRLERAVPRVRGGARLDAVFRATSRGRANTSLGAHPRGLGRIPIRLRGAQRLDLPDDHLVKHARRLCT